MSAPPTILETIHAFYSQIPLSYSLPLHCIFVSSLFSETFRSRWLLCFWITYFGAFGGGTAASYLMGDLPALFKAASVGPIYALSWWAFNYTFVGSIYNAVPPIRWLSKATCNMLKAKLICAHVEKAAIKFPGVHAGALILGTLSGCGGKMISDGMKNMAGLLPGNSELTEPGFSFWGAFLSASANYLLVHILKVLSVPHGEALVVATLVLHGLAQDLTGWPLDWTQPVRWAGHLVTRIPMTGDVPIVLPVPKRVYNKERENSQREGSVQTNAVVERPSVSKTKKEKGGNKKTN